MYALRLPDVCAKVGFSPAYVYRLISQGLFPKPAKCGRASIWSAEEVDTFLATKFSARSGEVPA